MSPTEYARLQDKKVDQAFDELGWLLPLAIIVLVEFTWVVATWNPDLNEVLLRFIVIAAIGFRCASKLFVIGDSR